MTTRKINGKELEANFNLEGSEAFFVDYGVARESETYGIMVITASSVKQGNFGIFDKTDPGYKRIEISVYLGQYDDQVRPRLDEPELDYSALADEMVSQGIKTEASAINTTITEEVKQELRNRVKKLLADRFAEWHRERQLMLAYLKDHPLN